MRARFRIEDEILFPPYFQSYPAGPHHSRRAIGMAELCASAHVLVGRAVSTNTRPGRVAPEGGRFPPGAARLSFSHGRRRPRVPVVCAAAPEESQLSRFQRRKFEPQDEGDYAAATVEGGWEGRGSIITTKSTGIDWFVIDEGGKKGGRGGGRKAGMKAREGDASKSSPCDPGRPSFCPPIPPPPPLRAPVWPGAPAPSQGPPGPQEAGLPERGKRGRGPPP